MRILVTGASSFIGKYLIRELDQLGHEVTGTYYKNYFEMPGIKVVPLNLDNYESVKLLFVENEFDIVFHLASYMPKQKMPEVETVTKCMNVNSVGTYYLLDCCHRKDVKKFVYPSTATVYDRDTTPLPAKEGYVLPRSLYSASKYLGEIFCEYFRKKGLATISLRISSVYGFGQEPYCVLPIFVGKAIRSEDVEVWGSGARTQDFIYVEDVVNALIKVAFTETSGVFNVGSGEETSMISLAMTIRDIFNPDIKIINKPVEEGDTSRFFLDVSKAVGEWGFQMKYSLISGLEEYKRRWEESLEDRFDF